MDALDVPASLAEWDALIDAAINEPDPTLSNLKITRVHYLLSGALDGALGPGAGANFHSWAVWGSRKAGVTIRQEDLGAAISNAFRVAGLVGALVGLLIGLYARLELGIGAWAPVALAGLAGTLLGAGCGALVGRAIAVASRRTAARLILAGNRTVLEDIGRQTARFVVACAGQSGAADLDGFLAGLRPGPTERGGQDLLRQAFGAYAVARRAGDAAARHAAIYLANCLAVYHEHIRLEPYIKGSMPWIIRKCVTQRMLSFDIGRRSLAVSQEIPPAGGRAFPATLERLSGPAFVGLARITGAPLDQPACVARDWSSIRQRMRYIFPLFRALHLDPAVFAAPYRPGQMAAIAADRLPDGPLA
ncbi:MAG TPA: hypothetical protein VD886_25220 [Herpetosiphonaceae bacterium]|nr:hypothetical protein [Herpetosiphonaceae bacterium]